MNRYFFKLTGIILFSSIALLSKAQDNLDIINPYQIKATRSKIADTFYFSQNELPQKKIDTLRTYNVFLEERKTPFGTAYMCNGNEITKSKYLEYKQFWNTAGACKPCLLYTYDDKDILKSVAFQFQDCLCGSYKEYYDENKIKVEGQFKKNESGNWENKLYKSNCNKRDGVWTYYFENGTIEKTEIYENGQLKSSTIPVAILKTKNKEKQIIENTTTEDTDKNPPKKNIFQRIKDKTQNKEQKTDN